MGDGTSGRFRLSFKLQRGVVFPGTTVTTDAGQLLPRELDEQLGVIAQIERRLADSRTKRNRQVTLPSV
jgi:hypothetical protein